MKIKADMLLSELIDSTKQNTVQAENLNKIKLEKLNWKADENTWSVLECLEHLNLYGDFYLPEIEKVINQSQTKQQTYFEPGFLGDYFAKSMLPKEKLNRMKTFKSKNPNGSKLNKSTIDRFLKQQEKMLNLLEKAKTVNLNKVKTPTTLGKLVTLKLGDTFRVVINHNIRHLLQAENTLIKQH
ncbi:DinB family protein [Aestuariivivens sp. NBU2969]|uniref:DinB family protein n=1 Tax=Aestuariivivens sp. NBU2969 TaxID=2873267 RepID=UPI001CBDFABF|nr:DinB family protein [Aestuariivivens sp. NBU2969]